MTKGTSYTSKQPNEQGVIKWSAEENEIWQELYARQLSCIKGKVCDEYFQGLAQLNLSTDRIPQLNDVSEVLMSCTGWQCEPVPALIGFGQFFQLLAERKFPVATFIRSREEFDYLQEPDIFHEIFGHCPLLTIPAFANFTQAYGEIGLKASKEDRVYLARLYWFTVEFGLLTTPEGLRIFGGGIVSSPEETLYAIESEIPERRTFDIVDVLRTPYRIDIMQPIYFMLNKLDDLDSLRELDIMVLVEQAKSLGLHPAKFSNPLKKIKKSC